MDLDLEITCLCGHARERVQSKSTLPIETIVCHCNSCRHSTGTLYNSSILLLQRLDCIPNLQAYQSSANIHRYFCRVCGTHVCHYVVDTDSWYLSSGVVDRIIENEQVSSRLEKIIKHRFVGHTLDGGLSLCLPGTVESPAYCRLQGTDQSSIDQRPRPEGVHQALRLQAACHCGGVKFFIDRPNEASRTCSSPWPDLLRPYHTFSSANPEDDKWWIRGSDRYLAGTCACRSCRLAFGSPIVCWAFVPKANIFQQDGLPLNFESGSLQNYQSSRGTYREFCKVCGASVFWRCDERPELLDVAVGVLRPEEGSRAESWFEWWTERVSFLEDAVDRELLASFETGLRCLDSR